MSQPLLTAVSLRQQYTLSSDSDAGFPCFYFQIHFANISKFGNVCSLHDAPSSLRCIYGYLAIDNRGNMSDYCLSCSTDWILCYIKIYLFIPFSGNKWKCTLYPNHHTERSWQHPILWHEFVFGNDLVLGRGCNFVVNISQFVTRPLPLFPVLSFVQRSPADNEWRTYVSRVRRLFCRRIHHVWNHSALSLSSSLGCVTRRTTDIDLSRVDS